MTSGWPSARSLDGGIDEIAVPEVPGRLWLCGKHLVGPDPEVALARVGGDTIVCLNERAELVDRYPEYVAWLTRHADGGRAEWFPIPDLHAPPVLEFERLVEVISARLLGERRVIVHCGAGIGRAGTAAVGVLVRFGVPLDDAIDDVRRQRPMAGPEAGAQRDVLEQYAASRRG